MAFDDKSTYYDEGGIETIKVLEAKLTPEQWEGWLLGNIMKYSLRANWKGCKERDIEKIKMYTGLLEGKVGPEEYSLAIAILGTDDKGDAIVWHKMNRLFGDHRIKVRHDPDEACIWTVIDRNPDTVTLNFSAFPPSGAHVIFDLSE